jgi:hypothetical protein
MGKGARTGGGTVEKKKTAAIFNARCGRQKNQDERPFLIIFALDEFQFQYKNEIMDEEVETVCVLIRHAAIFQVH